MSSQPEQFEEFIDTAQDIPAEYEDLLTEKQAFAILSTLNPDDTIQTSPVWVDYDGGLVRINTAAGRRKDRNMRSRSNVSLCILDPDNPYRYIEIRGTVADYTTEGADDHIHKLSHKYLGEDYPMIDMDETRVIFSIRPDHVNAVSQ